MQGNTPNIRAVRAGKGRRLVVTWKGGAESLIDVVDHINGYAVFALLQKDSRLFRRVAVGEWGWCVRWSEEMEISADTLWRLALEQGAAWLRDWRTEHHMTQAEAARALGGQPADVALLRSGGASVAENRQVGRRRTGCI